MDFDILYQDENLAVINKPAGVVVNAADTASGLTIQEWWREWLEKNVPNTSKEEWQKLLPPEWTDEYGTPEQVFAERNGIVHRLDKETSGALLLAKNPGALANLLLQFRLRKTEKEYICLVHGKFQITEDTVQFPIGRSTLDRLKFQVVPEGRPAETKYKVLNYYPHFDAERLMKESKEVNKNLRQIKQKATNSYQGFSLVNCWPKTGRTHQIRVHLTHLRHPLVADPTYVGSKRLNLDQLWCPRLFLHAAKLGWHDPVTGQTRTVEVPLSDDLQNALTFLQTA
jgi:23S rRNA pseudouridine1911/1915/1917 synthase